MINFFMYSGGWLFFLIPVLISVVSQIYVSSTFRKYSKLQNRNNITGFVAAQAIADRNGLDCSIEGISGNMTDHYDPRDSTVRLSETVGPASTIAAVSVAAHEMGHVIQHQTGYSFIKLRSKLVPVVNISSSISPLLIFVGMFFSQFEILAIIGVVLFSFVVLFQFITLPVEFNASRRAINSINEQGLLAHDEMPAAKKVLTAAALTYVAGLLVSLLQLLRLVLIVFGGGRNNRK